MKKTEMNADEKRKVFEELLERYQDYIESEFSYEDGEREAERKAWLNKYDGIKEPLIKDERIRKAVRAWAEASNMNEALCEPLPKSVCFRTNCNEGYGNCMFLEFKEGDKKPNGWHTIAELCGEEEE